MLVAIVEFVAAIVAVQERRKPSGVSNRLFCRELNTSSQSSSGLILDFAAHK